MQGIGAGTVDRGAPVKVWAGDAAGGSDFAEERTGIDEVAGLDRDGFEVGIKSVQAEAVVEYHGVAGEIERLRKHHATALGGIDGSASRRWEVDAAVWRAWPAIQNASLAEIAAGGNSSERIAEGAVPEAFRSDCREDGAQTLALRIGASELLRIGLHEIGSDLQAFGGELSLFDVDRCRAGDSYGGFGPCGDGEFVIFWF